MGDAPSQERLRDVAAIMVQREPASSVPREGLPPDHVLDVPPDHDVTLSRSPGRLALTVTARSGRPETAELYAVVLTGPELVEDSDEALTFRGAEFARGQANTVTLTVVRGRSPAG